MHEYKVSEVNICAGQNNKKRGTNIHPCVNCKHAHIPVEVITGSAEGHVAQVRHAGADLYKLIFAPRIIPPARIQAHTYLSM
jgi:hypothetical protein